MCGQIQVADTNNLNTRVSLWWRNFRTCINVYWWHNRQMVSVWYDGINIYIQICKTENIFGWIWEMYYFLTKVVISQLMGSPGITSNMVCYHGKKHLVAEYLMQKSLLFIIHGWLGSFLHLQNIMTFDTVASVVAQ